MKKSMTPASLLHTNGWSADHMDGNLKPQLCFTFTTAHTLNNVKSVRWQRSFVGHTLVHLGGKVTFHPSLFVSAQLYECELYPCCMEVKLWSQVMVQRGSIL